MNDDSMKKIASHFMTMSAVFNASGKTDPYFSVLTDPKYRMGNLDKERIEEFYSTGNGDADHAVGMLARNGLSYAGGRALDFGCGLGRITFPLAAFFREVVGCDISGPHLEIARARAHDTGIGNVAFVQTEFDLVGPFEEGSFDFIHSLIVLQHMVPPLMEIFLSQFCRLLRPGGVALFQVPTSCPGYVFNEDVLDESTVNFHFQLHAIPSRDVLRIFRRGRCEVIDVGIRDVVGPGWESLEFLFKKSLPGSRSA